MSATVEGIDVSSNNGSVEWKPIAGAVGFAVIKVTEGRDFIDPLFSAARVRSAEAALSKDFVCYYHFAHADTPSEQDARNECRDFVQAVRAVGGRIGRNGVLDYERARKLRGGPDGDDEAWIRNWVDEYRVLTGQRPWIYGGSVLRDEHVGSTFNCPLWLPAYGPSPDPWVPEPWKNSKAFKLRMWQYTDGGTCPGVVGHVDRNRFYGTKAELRKALVG